MTIRPILALLIVVAACGPTTTVSPTPTVQTTGRPTTQPPTSGPTAEVTPTPDGTLAETIAPTTPVGTPIPPTAGPSLDLTLFTESFVEGLPPLVFVTNAGDVSGLLYAVGQEGIIFVLSGDGSVQQQPFLDIADRIVSGGEQGLLGLAFHPEYESNGRYFVNYTNNDGDTVISEFARSSRRWQFAVTDPASERILLTIQQPFANHNGGMIAFGPDGYLYIGMGDGGSGGDPMGNGQANGHPTRKDAAHRRQFGRPVRHSGRQSIRWRKRSA